VDRRMALLALRQRSRKASANPATLKAKTLLLSTIGSAANTIGCRLSWRTSSAAVLQLSLAWAILPRLQPKLRRRQSRSRLGSVETRSAIGWSPILPGREATRLVLTFFTSEVLAKRLGLLHELVPKAIRVALLVNPTNAASTEPTLRDVPEAARALG